MATALFSVKTTIPLLIAAKLQRYLMSVFSSVASKIEFPDSHSCASEAISGYHNHHSIIKIRDSYDEKQGSFAFRPVNYFEISKKR